jgi:hypothetical protein
MSARIYQASTKLAEGSFAEPANGGLTGKALEVSGRSIVRGDGTQRRPRATGAIQSPSGLG